MDLIECTNRMYEENLTCVAADEDGIIFVSKDKGIRPMLDLMEGCDEHGWRPVYQADMIIGKAAVLIADHCGIKSIFADVASEVAAEIAKDRGIDLSFRECVPHILNRQKTEEGPFESALNGVDPDDFDLVMEKIREVAVRLGQL